MKNFEKLGWVAQRLGNSGQPDVLVRNEDYTRSYVVEAKSGYSKFLYIPEDQVIRQLKWVEVGLMRFTRSLLAFKFAAGHKPSYKYWVMPDDMKSCGISCRSDGYVMETGTGTMLGYCFPTLEMLIRTDLVGDL